MNVFLSSKANRQLKKLPQKMHSLFVFKIQELGNHPFPSQVKKLSNREGWRIRIGDYRILYSVDQKHQEIIVLSVAHRKEAYR